MKKRELDELERLNEEKKLTKEEKKLIRKKVLSNFLIAFDILLFFIVLMITAKQLDKEITIKVYKISSIALFVFSLVLIEISYKKNNDELSINSIEMLVLSTVTLLTPYIFIEKANATGTIIGCYFMAYYILKNLIIYRKEKNKFLRQQSDIPQIVKKESQDELAQEEKERLSKQEPQKRKRGRPRKSEITNQ